MRVRVRDKEVYDFGYDSLKIFGTIFEEGQLRRNFLFGGGGWGVVQLGVADDR